MKLWFVLSAVGLVGALLSSCQGAPASEPASPTPAARPVTFNRDVAPILFERCATCHRPIEAVAATAKAGTAADPLCVAGAPFSLLEYESARRHAQRIAAATKARAMPPWLPETGHGEFANERRLTDGQIAVIQQWVEQGAPEGDPADLPARPTWPEGWQLGVPDVVLTSRENYTLEPGTGDVFRNFVLPVPAAPTRYVRAIEFRADNPKVLHHASVAIDPSRVSRRLDRADAGPGFATMPEDEVQNVFGWSPGKVPALEPAESAWALEEGSDLVVQVHMVQGTTSEAVKPAIGLFLTSTPPTRVPVAVKLESKSIDIPAGEASYLVEDSYVLPADVEAVSIYPHAHYLAKEMRATATLPNGTVTPLIWIKQWDVRWQDQYRFRSPVFLPKGTTLRMRFTYDNSASNPRQRNRPPQRVRWGARSTDEMGALWLEVIPRSAEEAGLLVADFNRRGLAADIAGAEQQVRTSPAEPAAHTRLGIKYAQAGRVAEAQARFEEALRLDPNDAEARSNLGTLLQLQGRIAEAEGHLREAVRLKPKDDRLRFNLGNGLHAAGRAEQAAAEYRRAIAINPENAEAHFNLAVLLGPQGNLAEAATHLQRVIEINPRNAEAYRNLAIALALQGRIDDAIRQARTAVRIQPDSAPARQYLDSLLAAKGKG
jgi:Flp pilus assembly protein TadD